MSQTQQPLSSSTTLPSSSLSLFESKLNSVLDDPFNLRNRKRSETDILKLVEVTAESPMSSTPPSPSTHSAVSFAAALIGSDHDKENRSLKANVRATDKTPKGSIRPQQGGATKKESTTSTSPIPPSPSLPSAYSPIVHPSPLPSLPLTLTVLHSLHLLTIDEVAILKDKTNYKEVLPLLANIEKRTYSLDTEDNVADTPSFGPFLTALFSPSALSKGDLVLSTRDVAIQGFLIVLMSMFSLSKVNNFLLYKSLIDTIQSILNLSRYGELSPSIVVLLLKEVGAVRGEKKIRDCVWRVWEGLCDAVGPNVVVASMGAIVKGTTRTIRVESAEEDESVSIKLVESFLSFLSTSILNQYSWETLDWVMILTWFIKDGIYRSVVPSVNSAPSSEVKAMKEAVHRCLCDVRRRYEKTYPNESIGGVMKKILCSWTNEKESEEWVRYDEKDRGTEVEEKALELKKDCRLRRSIPFSPLTPTVLSSFLPVVPFHTLLSSSLISSLQSVDMKVRSAAINSFIDTLREKEGEKERLSFAAAVETEASPSEDCDGSSDPVDPSALVPQLYMALAARLGDPNKLIAIKTLQCIDVIGSMIVDEARMSASSVREVYSRYESKFLPLLIPMLNDSKNNVRAEIMKTLYKMADYHQEGGPQSLLSFAKSLPMQLLLSQSVASSSSSASFTFGRTDFLSLLLHLSAHFKSLLPSSPPPKEYISYLKEVFRVVSDNLLDKAGDNRIRSEDLYRWIGEQMEGRENVMETWKDEMWTHKKAVEQEALRAIPIRKEGAKEKPKKESHKDKSITLVPSGVAVASLSQTAPFTISSLNPAQNTKKPPISSSSTLSASVHGRSNSLSGAIPTVKDEKKKMTLASTQPLTARGVSAKDKERVAPLSARSTSHKEAAPVSAFPSSTLLGDVDLLGPSKRFSTLSSSPSMALFDEAHITLFISSYFSPFYAQLALHPDIDKKYQFIEFVVNEWSKGTSGSMPSSASSFISVADVMIFYLTAHTSAFLSSNTYQMKFIAMVMKFTKRLLLDKDIDKEMAKYNAGGHSKAASMTVRDMMEFHVDHLLLPSLLSSVLLSNNANTNKMKVEVKNVIRQCYTLLNVSIHHNEDRVERWLEMVKMAMGRGGKRIAVEVSLYILEVIRLPWFSHMATQWPTLASIDESEQPPTFAAFLLLLSAAFGPLVNASPQTFQSFFNDVHNVVWPSETSEVFLASLMKALDGVKENDKNKGRTMLEEKEREKDVNGKKSHRRAKSVERKVSVKEKEGKERVRETAKEEVAVPSTPMVSSTISLSATAPLPSSSPMPSPSPSPSMSRSSSRRSSHLHSFTFSSLFHSYTSLNVSSSSTFSLYPLKFQLLDDFTNMWNNGGRKYFDMEVDDVLRELVIGEVRRELTTIFQPSNGQEASEEVASNAAHLIDGICSFVLLLCSDLAMMSRIPFDFLRELATFIIVDVPLLTVPSSPSSDPLKHDVQQKVLNLFNHILYCYPHFPAVFHLILRILSDHIHHYSPSTTPTSSAGKAVHMDSFIFISSLVRSLSEALLQHRGNEEERMKREGVQDDVSQETDPYHFSGPLFRSELIDPFLYEIHSMYVKVHNYHYIDLSCIPPHDFLTRTICDAFYVVWEMDRDGCRQVIMDVRGRGESSILDVFVKGMDDEAEAEPQHAQVEEPRAAVEEGSGIEGEKEGGDSDPSMDNDSVDTAMPSQPTAPEESSKETLSRPERRRLTGVLSRRLYSNLALHDEDEEGGSRSDSIEDIVVDNVDPSLFVIPTEVEQKMGEQRPAEPPSTVPSTSSMPPSDPPPLPANFYATLFQQIKSQFTLPSTSTSLQSSLVVEANKPSSDSEKDTLMMDSIVQKESVPNVSVEYPSVVPTVLPQFLPEVSSFPVGFTSTSSSSSQTSSSSSLSSLRAKLAQLNQARKK